MTALLLLVLPILDDRPPLTDALNFPPAWVCREQMAMSQAYQCWLQTRIECGLDWDMGGLRDQLEDARRRWRIWDWCLTAQGGYPSWCPRRALGELRQLLGDEDYYAGRMPTPYPMGR